MSKKSPIYDLVDRVNKNTTGIFKRDSELVVTLPAVIANVIKNNRIYLSEFIVAKIKGLIKGNSGHKEITDHVLFDIPKNLSKPREIIEDTRGNKKYLFININPLHTVVVEISRANWGKTEINTIYPLDSKELKRLENKFPVVFSSGETPNLSHTCL